MEGNLNIRFRGVCNIYILIHGKAWLQKVFSKSGSPLFTRKEYYIFIEWSCSINKISTPSKIFRNDEVTVRKAENLFIIIHCTEGHDDEISGAIFGCLLLEQVASFGEYFCRFLRPAVAGRRKEKFYHQ